MTTNHYVLVHGAWEGAWSWESITPLLEARGHRVTTVSLPGSYERVAPIEAVDLEGYVSAVESALDPASGPVVLVGHSLAGAIVSEVAERFSEAIGHLVYITAFLLETGGTVLGAMQSDAGGQLLPRLTFSLDGSYATVSEEVWREVGFHDVAEVDIQKALSRLAERQAAQPFAAPVTLTAERFGCVPKTYLRASLDRIVTPELQDRMIANWQVDDIVTIEAGHFPLLSAPEATAKALLAASAKSSAM